MSPYCAVHRVCNTDYCVAAVKAEPDSAEEHKSEADAAVVEVEEEV